MAPHVTKRRKLEHSDSEEESEGSFAGFDEISDAASDASAGAEKDGADESDVDMSGADDLEDFKDLQDRSEEEDESEDEGAGETPAPAVKATTLSKPTKRPASSLQDGVYTAESFKSNLFKLQVDELLQQVRLKYGKKEASAENAMRTLKTMIEQIPSRDALPVCTKYYLAYSQLTNSRYPKPRNLSSRLV
jgi:U3 small nucleolar RNA-associated protein 22